MGQFLGYTLPAFPGGINVIDPIDQVPETDAVDLLNVYPQGQRLELRKGTLRAWAADSAAVKTLANLPLATGTEYLVAASDNNLYKQNGTSSTSILGSTTPTSDEWQHTTFNTRLFLCNGVDTPQVWTGSGNCTDLSFTGGSTPTLSTLINVSSYKERLYFVQKDTAKIWYGNTKAIGTTALNEFDVSYYLKSGGFVVACGSWSSNIGTTTQDLFYVLGSEGDLLFYSGSSPADVAFQLVARYVIGKPLGYRSTLNIENDLWIITNQGIVPVSQLFQTTASFATNSISRKINSIIQSAASAFPFSYIYSGIYYQRGRKVFINFPITSTNTKQLVCNVETGAWTIYKYSVSPTEGTGGAVLSTAINEGEPYSGSAVGIIYQLESGYVDDSGSGVISVPIPFEIRGGFNFFGKRGLYKVFKDIRPIMKTAAGDFTLEMDIDTDFRQLVSYATIASPETDSEATATWDDDPWDSSPWSEEERYLFARYSLKGQGHCGALRIRGSLNALLEFNAFEIRYEEGAQT